MDILRSVTKCKRWRDQLNTIMGQARAMLIISSFSHFVSFFLSFYAILSYLIDSDRAAIGQFSGQYSTVQPVNLKLCFCAFYFKIKRYNKYFTNLVSRSIL